MHPILFPKCNEFWPISGTSTLHSQLLHQLPVRNPYVQCLFLTPEPIPRKSRPKLSSGEDKCRTTIPCNCHLKHNCQIETMSLLKKMNDIHDMILGFSILKICSAHGAARVGCYIITPGMDTPLLHLLYFFVQKWKLLHFSGKTMYIFQLLLDLDSSFHATLVC